MSRASRVSAAAQASIRGDHLDDELPGRPGVKKSPRSPGHNDQTVAVRNHHATIMTLFTLPLSSDSVGKVMS